jgi:hypothetical protein
MSAKKAKCDCEPPERHIEHAKPRPPNECDRARAAGFAEGVEKAAQSIEAHATGCLKPGCADCLVHRRLAAEVRALARGGSDHT